MSLTLCGEKKAITERIVIYLKSVRPSRVEVIPIIIPGVVQSYLEDDSCLCVSVKIILFPFKGYLRKKERPYVKRSLRRSEGKKMNLIFNEKFGRREDNVNLNLFHCLEGPLGQDFCSLLPLYHHSLIYLLHKYLLSACDVSGIVLGLGKMLNVVNQVPVFMPFVVSWAFRHAAQ